jgi:hypothetical protein
MVDLRTIGLSIGAVAGTALLLWPIGIWVEVKRLEKPKHTLLKTLQTRRRVWGAVQPVVQLRRYAPYLIAEVTVENESMREAMRIGFKQIAGFIFGDNTAVGKEGNEKVAMTAPVTMEQSGKDKPQNEKVAMTSPVTAEMQGNKYVISFVMPSKYTKDTLPRPNNENVRIKEVPAQTFAAYAWRGSSPKPAEVDDKKQKLLAILKQHDVTVKNTDKTHLWQYYPPFAPSWIRLQEVLVPIEAPADANGAPPSA